MKVTDILLLCLADEIEWLLDLWSLYILFLHGAGNSHVVMLLLNLNHIQFTCIFYVFIKADYIEL